MHDRADHHAKANEGNDLDTPDEPQRTHHRVGPRVTEQSEADRQQDNEREREQPVVADRLHPALGWLEGDHLVPPHLEEVIQSGSHPAPLDAVQHPCDVTLRGVLLGRHGVPHEVIALSHREGVVYAIVSEHPSLKDMPRRQHRELPDDRVLSLGVEQCAVRAVVGHDEQPGHREHHHDLDRQDEQRIRDEDQERRHTHVEREVAGEVTEAPPRRVAVGLVRNDVNDRLE